MRCGVYVLWRIYVMWEWKKICVSSHLGVPWKLFALQESEVLGGFQMLTMTDNWSAEMVASSLESIPGVVGHGLLLDHV